VTSATPANRVAELFAAVGGFRHGLEGYPKRSVKGSGWKVVWSNQWEPSTRQQHASDCYLRWWPDEPRMDSWTLTGA
jgi:DNA (cytosine-5)-methyltransferase 1